MRKSAILTLALLLVAGAAFAANELIVTELMYNSPGDDVEWIELYNNSGATLDLAGWYVLDDNPDHEKMYLSGTMAAGEVKVLVGTEALFTAAYPTVTNYFPVFFQEEGSTWALGNGGDGVRVHDGSDTLIFSMDYDDGSPWPTACDGDGPSLLLVSTGCADFADAACWMEGESMGTPGMLTQTTPNEDSDWGGVKSLYR